MFQGLIDAIPKIFYLLTMSVLSIIDLFQMLMRKLAGLDCYYVNGTAQTGDIVYDFLTGIFTNQYPIISTVFWGLVILGFILLFLSTIIAIIRSEYTTEKADNGKGKIMFKAFKSVVFFALVPIVTLIGVYLANIVLVAVDKATTPNTNNYSYLDTSKLQAVEVTSYSFGQASTTKTYVTYSLFGFKNPENNLPYGTTTTTFSGTIFKAAAYNANRVRVTANVADENKNFAKLITNDKVTNFDGLFKDDNFDTAKMANKIDIAFADNVVFNSEMGNDRILDYSSDYIKSTNNLHGDPWKDSEVNKVQICADKFNVQLVWYYYDLWQFNFIIGIGAAVICATIFINIIFGLMRRIIEMIGLFLIMPPLIGLMPLDNEKAYGSWRGSFIKKALMAYGAIGGMNIIFVLLPELQTIRFFGSDLGLLNWIVDTLLVLVALLAIKDFIALVSGLVGGDDANATGEKVGKDVGDLAGKAVKVGATAVGGMAMAGLTAAKLGVSGAKLAGKGVKGAAIGVSGAAKAIGAKIGGEARGATNRLRKAHSAEDMENAREDAKRRREEYEQDYETKKELDYKNYKKENFKDYYKDYAEKNKSAMEERLKAKMSDAEKESIETNPLAKKGFESAVKAKLGKAADAEFKNKFNEKYESKEDYTKKRTDAAVDLLYNQAQKARSVSRLENYNNSKFARWKHDPNHTTIGQHVGSSFKGVGGSLKSFGGSIGNLAGEISSIYTSNNFVEGFMGKEKDTLVDSAYRLAGTTKKAAAKAKETKKKLAEVESEKQKAANALKTQEEMLRRVLKEK